MKNIVLFSLLVMFTLMNILDIITALQILPGESNPLYLQFKSIIPLVFLKLFSIVAISFFYIRNKYPNNFTYFMLLSFLLMGTILLGIGVYSNILGILNPQIVVEASTVSTQEKVEAYYQLINIIFLIPIVIQLVTFKLYEVSINNVKIEAPKHWWEF